MAKFSAVREDWDWGTGRLWWWVSCTEAFPCTRQSWQKSHQMRIWIGECAKSRDQWLLVTFFHFLAYVLSFCWLLCNTLCMGGQLLNIMEKECRRGTRQRKYWGTCPFLQESLLWDQEGSRLWLRRLLREVTNCMEFNGCDVEMRQGKECEE